MSDSDEPGEEQRMLHAIAALREGGMTEDGKWLLNVRGTARSYNVDHTSLARRARGGKSRKEAHADRKKVSPAAETVLVEWVKVLGRRGIPMTAELVLQYAQTLADEPLGESWVRHFKERNPTLKLRWTSGLEQCRARALNRPIVEEYFNILKELILTYKIPVENIYNMDEKGVQMGVGKRVRAFVDRDQKVLNQVEAGSRELITIIECASADGGVLHPSVIYQGKRRDLAWSANNPCNASLSFSPNGWTDQELGFLWLKNDFEPATTIRNTSNGYRLLILDGHNSHCTWNFCKFADERRIIILCLPSHTTHALQPCDVGIFGPLASCWKAEVNAISRADGSIDKYNFLEHYHNARSKAFQSSTIVSAFRKTGISPLNPDIIDPILYEPSKNTTTQSAQPLSAVRSSLLTPIPEEPSSSTSGSQASSLPASDSITPSSPSRRYILAIPPTPTRHTSKAELLEQMLEVRALAKAAGVQLEKNFAQMQLMEKENGRLRARAFGRPKVSKRLTSSHARHMTGPEQMDALAKANWEALITEVHSEAKLVFKERRSAIDQYYRDLAEREKKDAQELRKAEKAERDAAAAAEKIRKAEEKAKAKAETEKRKAEERAEKERAKEERKQAKAAEVARKAEAAAARTAKPARRTRRGAIINSDEAEYHDTVDGTPRMKRRTRRGVNAKSPPQPVLKASEPATFSPMLDNAEHMPSTSEPSDGVSLQRPQTPPPPVAAKPRPRPVRRTRAAAAMLATDVDDNELATRGSPIKRR